MKKLLRILFLVTALNSSSYGSNNTDSFELQEARKKFLICDSFKKMFPISALAPIGAYFSPYPITTASCIYGLTFLSGACYYFRRKNKPNYEIEGLKDLTEVNKKTRELILLMGNSLNLSLISIGLIVTLKELKICSENCSKDLKVCLSKFTNL